jgi:type IX secretion system PorP/SprF family membrane protein
LFPLLYCYIVESSKTKKLKKLYHLVALLTLTLCSQFATAQDIHFSQIGYAPLHLNPALTGIFEGDMRLIGNYRTQWNTVPVGYETFSGAYDMSFLNKNYERRFFSAGVMLTHDQAGDSRLSFTNVVISGSYTHRVAKGHYLTAGLAGAFTHKYFDVSGLQFDRQFSDETRSFDPTLDAREANLLANNTTGFADISGGFNWHYRAPSRAKRTSFDVGIASMHFNQPAKPFLDDKAEQLPMRWSMYGFGNIEIVGAFDLLLHATYQDQGPHREMIYGAGLQYHINTDFDKEFAIQAALNRRSEDALSFMLGMRYRMWKGAFSYDLNTSDFAVATNRRAGPELSIIYIINRVKIMPTKICPAYL